MEGTTASILPREAHVGAAQAASPGLRYVRMMTAVCCASLVAGAVLANTLQRRGPVPSVQSFADGQVAVLGYTALVLAAAAVPFGLLYSRGVAGARGIAPQVRAIHMTISLSAIVICIARTSPWRGDTVHGEACGPARRPVLHARWRLTRVSRGGRPRLLADHPVRPFVLPAPADLRRAEMAHLHHGVLIRVAFALLQSVYRSGLIPRW